MKFLNEAILPDFGMTTELNEGVGSLDQPTA
jgi:hypothetical protein